MSLAPVRSCHAELLIALQYDPGGGWVELIDSPVIGWVVDAANVNVAPSPRIYGPLPEIWGTYEVETRTVLVPGVFRGSLAELCTWLATNNGAQRLVGGFGLRDQELVRQWQSWAAANPLLASARGDDESAPEFSFRPEPGAPTVMMEVPLPVSLTLWIPAPDGGQAGPVQHHFEPGGQAVPVLLSRHSYLRAHGSSRLSPG